MGRVPDRSAEKTIEKRREIMEKRDGRRRLFKTFTACLLAVAMLLTNVMGVMEVQAAGIPAPTITKAFIGTNTISGGNVHVDKVSGKVTRGTVHVTLKDKGGAVKADNLTFTPKSGKNWTVDLPAGVTIAEGDTVTAYQVFDGQQSPETTANAMDSLAKQNKDKLQMPTGEIWIEQPSSNQVNEDEQAEAVKMLKDANTAIAGDIKSVKFSIDTAEHAYYEVTYTDGSTSGKIEATNLKIKQVTEHSRGATLGSITIVDNVIKGKLAGKAPFDGIKVQILLKLSDAVKDSYCDGGKCLVDKDTSDPVDATVNGETGEFTYTIPNPDLKLDQKVGVTVKEPHKFKSCSQTTVQPVKVDKTEVKDPRKLTAEDKKAIDAAIRSAYTVNGVSKLPNGTGDWDGVPAVIQIDDSGNAKIFSGNNVKGDWDWDNGGIFVPEKNEDGSVKLNDGAEPTRTIPAKDLLKNIKPDAPEIKVNESDKTKITINAKAVDTDANVITVSYTGSDDSSKTLKATKADDGTWSITEGEGTVDENGVVTLEVSKVKGGTKVTATVTDKGGIADDDKEALTSDQAEFKVTKAILVEALGGLDPVVMKKWVGDELNWKDGVEASKSASDENKGKIKEFLDEAGTKFTDETTPGRNTDAQGDYTGTIKVAFDDGSSIEVNDQKLYVSNHVTSMDRKDKVPTDALDVEFKLGEGTKVDNTDGTSITGPNSYQKYKVKPGTNLKSYQLPVLNSSVVDSIKLTAQDGYTEPVWRDSKNGTDFVATTENNVFTATATKTFKVTVQANGGTGDDKVETKKSGEKYTLPKGDTFTAPENKEFAGWLVGDATTTTDPGTEITITSDTVIKASWKPITVDVIFDKGEGSGEKDKVSVVKGSDYTLPDGKEFTPPEGKEFDGWMVGTEKKAVGDKITVNENTTVTAKYKPITVDVIFDKGEGSGEKDKVSVAKGSEYTLPDSEGFTPPEGKEFAGWEVNGETKNVGDKITVNENTTVTAKWKDKAPEAEKIIVKFIANGGKGSMTDVIVKKGEKFKLPPNGFTAPEGQEFDGWDVNGTTVAAGTEISVDGNMTLKAKWKAKGTPSTPDNQDPSQPGKPDSGTYYKGSTLIMPDRASEPAKPAMEIGRHIRYLYGYEDRTVRPQGKITRAEAAALIARLAELDMSDKSKPDFADTPSAWYNSAINIMVKKDLMFGDKNGNFRPSEPITRGEFARALLYIDAKNDKVAPFADVKGHQFEAAINQAFGNGRINGYPDGTFRPDDYIQRAEAARMLNQYANRGTTLEGMAPVAKDLARFTDIDESHWAYCEIMEAANSHEYQRVKGTQAETWLKILYDDMKK